MLSKILKKETCADCKFCCSFRRQSLWETPLFPMNIVEKLEKKNHDGGKDEKNLFIIENNQEGSYGRMNLDNQYKTNNPNEEVACSFLDLNKGCTLSDEDKPFDCKIWPLRIMERDNQWVIALTPTCPAVNKVDIQTLKELVDNELGQMIYDYAKKNPFIVKKYKTGFPVLKIYDKVDSR